MIVIEHNVGTKFNSLFLFAVLLITIMRNELQGSISPLQLHFNSPTPRRSYTCRYLSLQCGKWAIRNPTQIQSCISVLSVPKIWVRAIRTPPPPPPRSIQPSSSGVRGIFFSDGGGGGGCLFVRGHKFPVSICFTISMIFLLWGHGGGATGNLLREHVPPGPRLHCITHLPSSVWPCLLWLHLEGTCSFNHYFANAQDSPIFFFL